MREGRAGWESQQSAETLGAGRVWGEVNRCNQSQLLAVTGHVCGQSVTGQQIRSTG